MADLTPKQQRFVAEYLVDLNATQAAIRAGYSVKTASQVGHENLIKPEIQKAIAEAIQQRATRTELSQDWVVEQLRSVYATAMKARPVLDREGRERGFTLNLSAANRALELLGRHRGMFTGKLDVGVNQDLLEGLQAIDGNTRRLPPKAIDSKMRGLPPRSGG